MECHSLTSREARSCFGCHRYCSSSRSRSSSRRSSRRRRGSRKLLHRATCATLPHATHHRRLLRMHLCTGVSAQQPTSQHGGVSYIVTPVQQQHTHVQGSVQSPADLTRSALLIVCRVKGHRTSAELVWQERLWHACVHRLGAVDCAMLQPSIYMHTHACAGGTCARAHTHTHARAQLQVVL